MSLASLKRELATQQSQREVAREEARARIADQTARSRGVPWAAIAGLVAVAVVVFLGLAYALRASFPEIAELALPAFVYVRPDAGPPPAAARAPLPTDAGPPDAPHAAHGGGHHRRRDAGRHGAEEIDLGTGSGEDPIEGL